MSEHPNFIGFVMLMGVVLAIGALLVYRWQDNMALLGKDHEIKECRDLGGVYLELKRDRLCVAPNVVLKVY
jgi:hypothetical protein